MKKIKVLVTPKKACELISDNIINYPNNYEFEFTNGKIDNDEELINLLKNKDAVILDLENISSLVIKKCPELKIISRFGIGYNNIDIKALRSKGVMLAITYNSQSEAVSRHTLALILSITNNIVINDNNLKQQKWIQNENHSFENLTLGIVGYGNTGKLVSHWASLLGLDILVYSRSTSHYSEFKSADSLSNLIENSDIISLHLPSNNETRNILSDDILEKFKGKYLINTSRGDIVNEKKMFNMLNNNLIEGYALDTFTIEPVKGYSKKIAEHPRVIASPHIAALDEYTAQKMCQLAMNNLTNFFNGNDKLVYQVI